MRVRCLGTHFYTQLHPINPPPQKDKRVSRKNLLTLVIFGRRGGIRTRDPLHPMQVRYQAALHAEDRNYNL